MPAPRLERSSFFLVLLKQEKKAGVEGGIGAQKNNKEN